MKKSPRLFHFLLTFVIFPDFSVKLSKLGGGVILPSIYSFEKCWWVLKSFIVQSLLKLWVLTEFKLILSSSKLYWRSLVRVIFFTSLNRVLTVLTQACISVRMQMGKWGIGALGRRFTLPLYRKTKTTFCFLGMKFVILTKVPWVVDLREKVITLRTCLDRKNINICRIGSWQAFKQCYKVYES